MVDLYISNSFPQFIGQFGILTQNSCAYMYFVLHVTCIIFLLFYRPSTVDSWLLTLCDPKNSMTESVIKATWTFFLESLWKHFTSLLNFIVHFAHLCLLQNFSFALSLRAHWLRMHLCTFASSHITRDFHVFWSWGSTQQGYVIEHASYI